MVNARRNAKAQEPEVKQDASARTHRNKPANNHNSKTKIKVPQRKRRRRHGQAVVLLLVLVVVLLALVNDKSILRQFSALSFPSRHELYSRTVLEEYWCGAWTPRGNLGHANYSRTFVEPLFVHGRLCTQHDDDSSTSSSSPAVGQEFVPNNETTQQLYCHPDLTGGGRRAASVLALDMQRQQWLFHNNETTNASIIPEYTVIVPSYNSADTLRQTTPTLCQYTTGRWEVIFILDACWDDSLQVLYQHLTNKICLRNPGLLRARILIQPTSIWETSSDNLGFMLASATPYYGSENSTPYAAPSHAFIEVQADMFLTEHGWNRRLVRPFLQYGDIVSVSGRCGHGVFTQDEPAAGRCGANVQELDGKMKRQTRNSVIVTATNNRGPLALRPDALQRLGYLDEVNFYLGSDDHDLNRRAMQWGWHAAYSYTAFYAPLNLSPQRNEELLQQRKNMIPETTRKQEEEYLQWRRSTGVRAQLMKECHAKNHSAKAGHDARTPREPWEERPLNPIPRRLDWNAPLPPLVPLVFDKN